MYIGKETFVMHITWLERDRLLLRAARWQQQLGRGRVAVVDSEPDRWSHMLCKEYNTVVNVCIVET